jgi:hypothetical protein
VEASEGRRTVVSSSPPSPTRSEVAVAMVGSSEAPEANNAARAERPGGSQGGPFNATDAAAGSSILSTSLILKSTYST